MIGDDKFVLRGKIAPAEWPNPWARISDIARRLNVAPLQPGDVPSITARGGDGLDYDVFKVVEAVLDRIDAATK